MGSALVRSKGGWLADPPAAADPFRVPDKQGWVDHRDHKEHQEGDGFVKNMLAEPGYLAFAVWRSAPG